jgi:type I restriction enzyme M protein
VASVRVRGAAQAGQGEPDLFWLKDESLEGSDELPAPDVLAHEIADDLQAALEQFAAIAEKLKG